MGDGEAIGCLPKPEAPAAFVIRAPADPLQSTNTSYYQGAGQCQAAPTRAAHYRHRRK